MKIIDVYGNWCGPCKVYAPIFEKVSKDEKYKDIEFKKIDVDENEELASKYNVRNIPTTLFISDDEELVAKLPGMQTEQNLRSKIEETFNI